MTISSKHVMILVIHVLSREAVGVGGLIAVPARSTVVIVNGARIWLTVVHIRVQNVMELFVNKTMINALKIIMIGERTGIVIEVAKVDTVTLTTQHTKTQCKHVVQRHVM